MREVLQLGYMNRTSAADIGLIEKVFRMSEH
jgi:hypothetical protein